VRFLGFGNCVAIGLAAAMLAACGDSHSTLGAPANAVQPMNARVGPAATGEQVLFSFSGGNDGGDAATGLVIDGQGNLYGTTVIGGTYACGTAFKLTPRSSLPWQETVLNSFDCFSQGKNPYGGVTFDSHGNLDGTTVAGGSGGSCAGDGCGIVFQLKPSTENVLHSFTAGNDGFGPGGAVAFDSAGKVYGTTPDGGAHSQGVVYEVSPAGTTWHERVIHAFSGGRDGSTGSLGALLVVSGSLYGVTELGGAHKSGTVFKLTPSRKNRWQLTTLYAFKGMPDAAFPYGGLVADASSNLYGTTYYGGTNGLGSVFKLIRSGARYRERVLYSFKGGNDGSSSTSTLVFGKSNDLYGTTSAGGGSCDCGAIFRVNASSGKETVLHSFGAGTDGASPSYGLTPNGNGNFFGATVGGGNFGQGTVFEFTP
jgi:uncharacterized repeat protein (TIGR03803 family)